LSTFQLVAIGALIVSLAACGRFDASREFNYGVTYFNEEKFDAAARSFERASKSLNDPAIHYNLALAHLALLRESSNDDDSSSLQPQQVAAALAAVAAARELPEPTDEMLAKLGYIEGSIHALAGDEEAARRLFDESLEAEPDFKPTLKALLELDPESDTAVARLVLAAADVETLKPEEELSK
jgi:tetratricopeptide (TPR) repeat protein